jgi:nucleotide-binding universal stress UspA family protein
MPREPVFSMVIALDLSEYAEVVLEHALDQAIRHDAADLHFVHVIDRDRELRDAHARLSALVRGDLELYRERDVAWRVHLHVRAGKPHEEIIALAGDVGAQMIVVGRFEHQGVLRRLGSVAHRVVEDAPCPTLAVHMLDRAVEPRCTDCEQIREQTGGERWFCAAHSSADRPSLSSTYLPTSHWVGSTTMW